MPGLVPGIHVLAASVRKTWMAGTSPAMTLNFYNKPAPRAHLYFAPSTATGISVE